MIMAPIKEKIIAMILLLLTFSFSMNIANIAPKTGAVKLIAVAFANGIFAIEKNHKYIAPTAIMDLKSCNLIDLVLKLSNPSLYIKGTRNITAKKDLKKIT